MKNLITITSEYLSRQTNHAILVKGNWGVGKTYYFKKILSKEIEKIDLFNDASKKYKPLHISLFGLKSVDDVQKELFLSFNTFLKKEDVKISIGIAKALGRGLFSLVQLGNIDDYVADIKPDNGELLEIEQMVICFDDMERISPDFPIEELIGFINNLLEYHEAKILLIANDDKIKSVNYKSYKEKVIGVTIEYLPDLNEVIKSIVDSRYKKKYPAYADFLFQYKSIISKFTEANNFNLRTLIFSLDNLHLIYSQISNDILDNPKKKGLVNDDIMENLLRFILGISFEFKSGNISFNNKEGLDENSVLNISLFNDKLEQEDKDEIPLYINQFCPKYFYKNSAGDYKFYKSIYDHITGGEEFKIPTLIEEIEKSFHIKNNKVEKHYLVFNALQTGYDLDDKVYRGFVKDLVGFAEKGLYNLEDYLSVFYFATQFDNMMGYDTDKLRIGIIKGIKRGKKRFKHKHGLEYEIDSIKGHNYENDLMTIKDFMLKTNQELKEEEFEKQSENLIRNLKMNYSSFHTELSDSGKHYYHDPVFANVSVYKVSNAVKKLPLISLIDFRNLIINRYVRSQRPNLKQELPFLKELRTRLGINTKKRKVRNKRNYFLNQICAEIGKGIEALNSF